MEIYTVYILKLRSKRKIYIGVTSNFRKRLSEHKNGLVKSTRNLYDEVLYTERFDNKNKAWKKEKWFKSGIGREWIYKNVLVR